MNEKELKRISKKELLELLLKQTERIEFLEKSLEKTTKELESKKIAISESGSIAEASLKISGLFEKADESIKIYKKNAEEKIKKELKEVKEKELKELDKFCEEKKNEALNILSDAKKSKKKSTSRKTKIKK